MKCLTMIAVLVSVLASACSDTRETLTSDQSLPTPTLVDTEYFSDTGATYYKYWTFFGMQEPPCECSELLRELLDDGIQIKNAWFPASPTPCMVVGAVTIAGVELMAPDDDILDFGFVSDPDSSWVINCGVQGMWHYSFE